MEADGRKLKSGNGPDKRESPVERLRERSRGERKETNSRAKYQRPEGRHEKSGRREGGRCRKRKRRAGNGKTAARLNREGRERKKQRAE